ncbi:flagellar biosynthetic protein FliR [Anoxybacter fermentans]|uniref:Flagellar biosynthetic protein FliR n=1 Tax=Anoxybacter fermentans TaxID=1323375 RepID=A0A3Q9HRU7_9FIRM|nr:flagellar biosynthetic protein FliR [Anoxybacter fermentans]AZR73862.1 flagellar biosynthetic protein FliR [Anoxybacter fermentans]
MDEAVINTVYSFFLITIRFSGLFLTTPFFSSLMIPIQVKAGLTLLCSLILFPIIFAEELIPFPTSLLKLVFQVGNELLVGLVLGFTVLLTFTAFQLAGQFLDIRMGFALVNIVDPLTGSNAPLIGQFKNILAILILLLINGHHQIIRALVKSFQILPITKPVLSHQLLEYLFRVGGDIFIIAFRLSLPIIATLFVVDILFGFLARTVPQMNVFMLGFPIKILVGFLMLFLSIPLIVNLLIEIIEMMYQHLYKILELMK